ncbi:Protein of unknown function [Cognatiyoonia koreensis]|uniref:DUF3168 domain-containing protein n=1 Tax=Cognatiyoonia koreensis TaxID=364200 RepID=A0A1I0NS85_9RHOB|nr:DUF3168 domain-containing protein [Cognatiyoonia koreensis]SEW04375.1 Protein of unknown function [Cognatiyoonia koreensis]
MSYAMSAPLQAAVFQQLFTDPDLSALVAGNIFDALPSGSVPSLYVALGPEKVRDASDATGGGALHELTISVVSDAAGFAVAKEAAGLVSDALVNADLPLSRGALVSLNFFKAAAARVGTGDTRRIDLFFRARVCDAPQTP